MAISKKQIRELILEEFKKYMEEAFDGGKRGQFQIPSGKFDGSKRGEFQLPKQIDEPSRRPPPEQQGTLSREEQKAAIRQYLEPHLGNITRWRRVVSDAIEKMPYDEIQKTGALMAQKSTPDYLRNFLGINSRVPVLLEDVLIDPLGTLQSIVTTIYNEAVAAVQKKLTESDLPYLMRDPEDRKQKHELERKKKTKEQPALSTNDSPTKQKE